MQWEGLRPDDRVVIPAHNEEASIGLVVSYLMEHGLRGEQLFVVDSGCTDNTVRRACMAAREYASGREVRIVHQDTALAPYQDRLMAWYGLDLSKLRGKGLAMYSAALTLRREGHLANSRIFFIDGDITNPNEVDPIGCLLRAWKREPAARIVKLASAGRDNEGMIAFMNTLPEPYCRIADLAWPLCGQQSLRLYDFQRLPVPVEYSVEVALLAGLVELYGGDCFSQEPISVQLKEEMHPDDLQRYVRMYTRIMFFLQSVASRGGLSKMDKAGIWRWNQGLWRERRDVGVPHVSPNGSVRETLIVDELLPPVNNLVYD